MVQFSQSVSLPGASQWLPENLGAESGSDQLQSWRHCGGIVGGKAAGGGTALAAKMPVAAELAAKLAAKMPVAAKLAAAMPVAAKLPVAA